MNNEICKTKYNFSLLPNNHKADVLFTQKLIQEKVNSIADEINRDYLDKPLHIIIISVGGLIFGTDIIKNLRIPITIDIIQNNKVKYKDVFKDKHILILDGIMNTGETLNNISNLDLFKSSLSIATGVFINRTKSNIENISKPKYIGYNIRNLPVFGYGIDYCNSYRDLPQIWYHGKISENGSIVI